MYGPAGRQLLFSTVTAVLITAFPIPALAAGSITGRIVDPDGRPVAGAQVLMSGETSRLRSVTTDEDGRFTIETLEEGRLTIRVAADGFRSEALAVDGSGTRDVGVIGLTMSAFSESVVVSAAQVELPLSEVTSSVTVVSGAELKARQLHSVADALRAVPGLTLVSTGGLGATTGLFPRGGESNYTLVLVDGMPANAFGGDFDFGHLSTASIERLEIVRGPQSALYGSNAIGSVVRIVTRRGGAPAAQVSVEGGHYGTSRVTASTTGERGTFQWGAAFDQLLSDGMNGDLTEAGATIVNDDYERRAGTLSAGWRKDQTWVRGDLQHATDERGFPGPFGSNPIGAYEGIDTVSRGDNSRTVGSLSFAAPLSARVRAQGQAGYNRIESDFVSPFDSSESFSRRWAARGQADVDLGGAIDVSAGLEIQGERTGSTYITGATAQQIPIERTIAGYFGEGRWNARDRFFVVAGLRVEDIRRARIEESPATFSPRPALPAETVVSTNPRVSAAWIARPGTTTFTKIRGAVGTGIRPPDGFELAFTDNPDLRPERSRSAEAGVDHSFGGGLGLVEATAFFNEYDDLIVAVGSFSGSSRFRTDNISNARARGLELALTLRGRIQARRPLDIAARIGYTYLDSEILAVDQDDAAPPPFSAGQPLLRRPDHQFFADLAVTSGRISAFLRSNGRSDALDVEPSLGTFGGLFDVAGYQVWSAGGSWRLGRFAEVFGRVENLFDRSYEEALGFPALGRRATAGLRLAAGG
jgi:outer membrane cobalamin receptor